MGTPLFDVCVIARNEVKTLPKLRESLNAFFDAGGQANLLDTGSSDGTADLARQLGFNVKEVGEMFLIPIKNHMAINQKFVVEGEKQVVKAGDRYFDFSGARNFCADMARENVIFWYDSDEVSVAMDIDAINKTIEDGFTQWEYFFTFAFDQFGNEAVKFQQCKAYDKRVMRWQGRVHELVVNIDNNNPGKRTFLPENIYKLAHYQNHEQGRHSYMVGLAIDCFEFPNNDRHQFYFSRELLYNCRPKSALKGFKQHLRMGGWHSERSESLIHCGDIYGQLNDPTNQMLSYSEAFHMDSGRNAALIKLALYYQWNKNYQAAICYAKAALEIPYNGFYADNLANYREVPQAVLYACYGYIGKIDEAKSHLLKALEFQPYNPAFLDATKYYFPYHDRAEIQGWMRFPELLWLYEQAGSGKYKNMFECGSWKGKSTHALLSGSQKAEGVTITCVDTWQGSQDERDDTHHMAKVEDVFATFQKNTSGFNNLKTIRKSSVEAAKEVPDESIDFCFIDMGHTKVDVLSDLNAWFHKVKKDGIICGHDYTKGTWQEVVEAVNEFFGREPDYVVDSIWVFDLKKLKNEIHFSYELAPETQDADIVTVSGTVQIADENKNNLIPRKVYTAWFGDNMPELVKKCIESQRKMCEDFGYEHILFTLENLPLSFCLLKYIQDAFKSTYPNGIKYCKATDYLRMAVLYEDGGIFLDSDFEVLPEKNFDAMLNDPMFVGLEVADWANGKVVLGTAVVGSIPDHPMIKEWIETVERDFRGDDNLNYESSMDLLNKIGVKYQDKMHLYNPDFFFPFEWLHTGETKITPNTIGVHHFLRTWIPETNKKSTLQQFKYNIENNINFTFVKRGDGELACMNGEVGGNCDGHPYSKELGDKLREAYEYFAVRKNTTIVEFDDQINYNVLLHRTDSNLKEVSDFYKAISTSNRTKYFIGPERLRPVCDFLKAKHIVIPELNWWDSYDEIMNTMPLEPAAIYLFCAGMPAKVLMHDIMKYEYNSPPGTYLDCGSAFDPSVGITRTFQISPEEFNRLYSYSGLDESNVVGTNEPPHEEKTWYDTYADELAQIYDEARNEKKTEVVNNFLLPQATHPERLWVLDSLDPKDHAMCLDLGCGRNLTFASMLGFDMRAKENELPRIYPCDIHDLSKWVKDNEATAIVSRHSVEHLLDPVKALKEWIRVLRPGCKMVIILPDHEFINTIDPYYSAGEHLHAYTLESFKNLISLFPDLHISKQETVLKDWSFGTVIYKLPKISFILPQLGRQEGLDKCLKSIDDLDYPVHLIEVTVIEGQETVPEKVAEGLRQSTGQYICYCANDMYFFPDTIITSVIESLELNKGLVSFNEGNLLLDNGNICTHFIISRDLVSKLDKKEIFCTEMAHCGVDNYLWAQCEKLGEAYHSSKAAIVHTHFSKGGEMDETYEKGWRHIEQDRKLLAEKLLTLNGK